MHLLRTENLIKVYSGRRVVNEVNIEIRRGEIVGLLGPNGAGKTTTFYMVVGIVRPDRGKVLFDDRDITNYPIHKRARLGMAYLPQESSVFKNLTVEENVLAILETLNIPRKERYRRAKEALAELNLLHLAKSKCYMLSGGERRRLEITRALLTNPMFLLLDEPFSGIDPIVVYEAQQIILGLKRRGLGILLTDHNVRETLSITDRAYLIAEGRILFEGKPQDLVNNPEARRMYLGKDFKL